MSLSRKDCNCSRLVRKCKNIKKEKDGNISCYFYNYHNKPYAKEKLEFYNIQNIQLLPTKMFFVMFGNDGLKASV